MHVPAAQGGWDVTTVVAQGFMQWLGWLLLKVSRARQRQGNVLLENLASECALVRASQR